LPSTATTQGPSSKDTSDDTQSKTATQNQSVGIHVGIASGKNLCCVLNLKKTASEEVNESEGGKRRENEKHTLSNIYRKPSQALNT
jgi:chorismate synthase